MNIKLRFTFFFTLLISTVSFAQLVWTPSTTNSFGNTGIHSVNAMKPFKGMLYAATGNWGGEIYRTATGNNNDWNQVYSGAFQDHIYSLGTTNEGGGYIYMSTYDWNSYNSYIYRSFDGTNWDPYLEIYDRSLNQIVSFKGAGIEDSMYVFDNNYMGTMIYKSAYNSNDPTNALSSWQTVFDFSQIAMYTKARCVTVANGKMYIGTDNGAQLWTSTDGIHFNQNLAVGYGFGDANNYAITSITNFNGYIYVITENGYFGHQVWRSNDDVNWTMVNQFPTSVYSIQSAIAADNKLWLTTRQSTGINILNSVDGINYVAASTPGFGESNNNGYSSVFAEFNNNLYVSTESYFSGGRGGGGVAKVFRTCLGTLPPINLGADFSSCYGVEHILDAGPGMVNYYWNTEDTTQTITVNSPGTYICTVTGSNGCANMDNIVISPIATPDVYINYPNSYITGSDIICRGDTLKLNASAYSNVWNASAPIHEVTSLPVLDYQITTSTITVSGVGGWAWENLYKVTIDSMTHTYCGDLEMKLYAPDGSNITLTPGYGGGSDDFYGMVFSQNATVPVSSGSGPYTGEWLPFNPFNWLGGTVDGDWTLQIYDQAGGDEGILKGWSIQFATPDSNITISWTPAATFITPTTILNPEALPQHSGPYAITVTNTLGCSSTASVNITVPSPQMTVSDDSICYGGSAILTATGPNLIWGPAATLSSTTGSIVTATPTATTMYYVSDTILGCYAADTTTIYYSPQLFVTASTPQTICYSASATLTANPSGGVAPYTYLWSDGASFSGTNQNEIVSPSTSSSYTVYAFDTFGCLAGDFTNIAVTPSTDIDGHVTYSGGALANGGTVVLYRYFPFYTSFDTAAVTTLNAMGDYHFTAVNFGDYIVKVFPNASFTILVPTYYGNTYLWDAATVLTHGCTVNDVANITMTEHSFVGGPGALGGRIVEGPGFERLEGDPIPGIDVKLGRNPGGQLVTNTTTNSNGYYSFGSLALNDGAANGVSYTVYVDIPGLLRDSSYVVTIDATTPVLDSLNYMVDSTTIYIVPTSSTGISNIALAKENKFSVYPNPFRDNLTVSYTLNADADVKLEVYSIVGVREEIIINTQQQKGEYKFSLNNNLSSGVYFISLTINGNTSTQRVIKTE
jgi:subtilisin-like proprotein convertase family protein